MRILNTNRNQPVVGLAISRDGRTLIAASGGGFDIWNLPTGTTASFEVEPSDFVFVFVLDPLARWVYFSSARVGSWICDLRTGEGGRFPGLQTDQHVISLAASPDGTRVALSRGAYGHNRLECWAIEANGTLSLDWSVPAPRGEVSFHGLAFDPSGERLAAIEDVPAKPGDTSFPIHLRSAATGDNEAVIGSMPNWTGAGMAFTPAGNHLLAWDQRRMYLFDLAEQGPVRTLDHFSRLHTRGLAIHPSGRFLVTVASDSLARIWDVMTLTQLEAFDWEVGTLQSAAFSPDGMFAAAGSNRGQVVLWDVDM